MRTTRDNAMGLRAPTPRGPDGRRGAALMLALIVLAALFLLALPFAVFMRMQHGSGTQALRTAKARAGSEGALDHAMAVLGQSVETPPTAFPFDNEAVDTLWEFHVTLRTRILASDPLTAGADAFGVANGVGFPNDGDANTVDGYVRVDNEWLAYTDVTFGTGTEATLSVRAEHRGLFGTSDVPHIAGSMVSFYPSNDLWDLDVKDQQALININTAPYYSAVPAGVILNLLGYLGVGGAEPGDAAFPTPRQRALALAISSYRLQMGTYSRFANLNQIKNIAEAPFSTPLQADEFDKIRRYVTVHSAGGTWITLDLQADIVDYPATPLTGNQTSLFGANLWNAQGLGVGTLIRFTSGATSVYRTVLTRNEDAAIIDAGGGIRAGDTEIRIADATGFHGASDTTPGYIYLSDGNQSEWIRYTGIGVAPGGNPMLTGVRSGDDVWRNPLDPLAGTEGTTYAHHGHGGGNALLDGCVITLSAPLATTYTAGSLAVEAEGRHPININTVTSPIILCSILNGIEGRLRNGPVITIDDAEARRLADALLDYTSGEDHNTETRNWFDGDENWFDGDADNDGAIETTPRAELEAFFRNELDADHADLVIGNFSTDPVQWPAVSTMPLVFKSCTMIGIDSQGIVDNLAGTPIAQVPLAAGMTITRIYDVVPPLEPLIWWLRSQSEFYNHMTQTWLSSHVLTNALNMGLGSNTFDATAMTDYLDTTQGIGTAAPALEESNPAIHTTMLEGLHGAPDFGLDYSVSYALAPDTAMVLGTAADTTNTTSEGTRDVHLQYSTGYANPPGDRHIEADSQDATMQPLAVEFWMRPDDVTSNQVLVDLGDTATPDISHVRLYLDAGQLKLRIHEPVADRTAEGYGNYVEATSSFTFQTGRWYHVAVAVAGTFRHEIAMFIDGIYDRQMTWAYDYGSGTADETTVEEGSFLPLAMRYPNRVARVTVGPGAMGEWPAGLNQIGLDDITWLPAKGAVVIGFGAGAEAHAYNGFGTVNIPGTGWVDTIRLVDFDGTGAALASSHTINEPVAMMLPVVRPVNHNGDAAYSLPLAGDDITLCRHELIPPYNRSYRLESYANPVALSFGACSLTGGWLAAAPDWSVYEDNNYLWLGPDLSGVGAFGGVFPDIPDADLDPGLAPSYTRWKVLVTHRDPMSGAIRPVLAGVLPTGPLADPISIGDAGGAGARFTGELDELRVTALPNLLVEPTGAAPPNNGWAATATTGNVERWQYFLGGWNVLQRLPGYAFDMVDERPLPDRPRPMPDGGLFMVLGTDPATGATSNQIYSYETFDGLTFGGIAQMNDDLTPAEVAGVPLTGFAQAHEGLSKLIPLNFMQTTRVVSDIGTAILVQDVTGLPPSGYVKIDDEILAYGQIASTSGLPQAYPQGELALGGGFRRGCYGTTSANHAADAIVRVVPVRHEDRYETGGPLWPTHVTYTNAELGNQMCMYSFSVNHAGQLTNVHWRFKNPLENNQQVAVVVVVDDAATWNTNPDASATDLIWGRITAGGQEDDLDFTALGRPTVNNRVEVRFYFDLSDTDPYNTTFTSNPALPGGGTPASDTGWINMVEIDEVSIEMVPTPSTF